MTTNTTCQCGRETHLSSWLTRVHRDDETTACDAGRPADRMPADMLGAYVAGGAR